MSESPSINVRLFFPCAEKRRTRCLSHLKNPYRPNHVTVTEAAQFKQSIGLTQTGRVYCMII
jgi:hypothetical protein